MTFWRSLVILSLVGVVNVAHADVEERFQADHRAFFSLLTLDPSDQRFRYVRQPGNEEDGGEGRFDLQQFQAKFEVPLPVDEDFYFRFGGEYQARLLDFADVPAARSFESSETLHKIAMGYGAGIFMGDDLLLTGMGTLGAYSDLDDTPEIEDFSLQGEALLVYRINPGTQLVGGAARTNLFDHLTVYPLFGIRVRSETGALHVGLTLPHEIWLGYSVSNDLKFYGGLWLSGDKYRVDMGRVEERFDIHVQDRRLGGGLQYWFTDRFNLLVEGGMTLGGEFELDAEQPGQFTDDLGSTGYLAAGLGIAL